jgi:uncharacterized protein
MRRQDWLLLGLAAAKDAELTPVQLQKMMFLLRDAFVRPGPQEVYDFVPYHYGPFDSSIYRDAEDLESRGLVTIAHAGTVKRYRITPEGMRRAQELAATAPTTVHGYLQRLVDWMLPLSFAELVRAVYAKYPDYRRNSVFQG